MPSEYDNGQNSRDIVIELNSKNLEVIKNNFMDIIDKIMQKYNIKVSLNENNKINYEKINIIYNS